MGGLGKKFYYEKSHNEMTHTQMTEVYWGEEVRILSEQSGGSSYGITLPNSLLDYRFRPDKYIKLSLLSKETLGTEITYISGIYQTVREGRFCRKIQGGSDNHPRLKIGLPIEWTRDEGKKYINLSEHENIVVEAENQKIRIFKQKDYSLVKETGSNFLSGKNNIQQKYSDWLAENKNTKTFQLTPIDGFNEIFLKNIERDRLKDFAEYSLIDPSVFEKIKTDYELPEVEIDAVVIKWNPDADAYRLINTEDTGEIIHVERSTNGFCFDFPEKGVFEISGHKLTGKYLEKHSSMRMRTWLAYLPYHESEMFEFNYVEPNWLAPYFDSGESDSPSRIYSVPWNDKRGDQHKIYWDYYCFFDNTSLKRQQYPYLFEDL